MVRKVVFGFMVAVVSFMIVLVVTALLSGCKSWKVSQRDLFVKDSVAVGRVADKEKSFFDSSSLVSRDSLVKVPGSSVLVGSDSLEATIEAVMADNGGAKVVGNEVIVRKNGSATLAVSKRGVECRCDSLEILVNDLRSVVRFRDRVIAEKDSAWNVRDREQKELEKIVEKSPWYMRLLNGLLWVLALLGVVYLVRILITKSL